MTEDSVKEFISSWSAYVCPVPGGAMTTWGKFLSAIPDEDYNLISDAIDNISQRSAAGHFKRNPNLGQLQAEYRHLSSMKTGESKEYSDCDICASSGLLSIVIAMDVIKHRQVPVPLEVAIPSPKADVIHTPCYCKKGKELMSPTFIKKGSQKSDEGRYYTEEQIIKLATKCGYTSPKEAESYRQKCERFFFAWKEKYPKKDVDQKIGYKGKENKQVMGFVQTVERNYDPSEY